MQKRSIEDVWQGFYGTINECFSSLILTRFFYLQLSRNKQKPETYKSIQGKCSIKKLFLRISQNSPKNALRKHLQPATLSKEIPAQVFPLNIAKLLKTIILRNIYEPLLLNLRESIYKFLKSVQDSLYKIHQNTGFLWPISSSTTVKYGSEKTRILAYLMQWSMTRKP